MHAHFSANSPDYEGNLHSWNLNSENAEDLTHTSIEDCKNHSNSNCVYNETKHFVERQEEIVIENLVIDETEQNSVDQEGNLHSENSFLGFLLSVGVLFVFLFLRLEWNDGGNCSPWKLSNELPWKSK